MAVIGDVLGSLQRMNLLQLLFGFLACTAYALAQGSLFDGRARFVSSGVAVLSALGFVVEADQWVYGFMLLAFAVAGMGLLTGAVWLMCKLLGFSSGDAPRAIDSAFIDPQPVEVSAVPTRVVAPGRAVHSH